MNNIEKAKGIVEEYRLVFADVEILENKMSGLQKERNELVEKLESIRTRELEFMNSLNDIDKEEILKSLKNE